MNFFESLKFSLSDSSGLRVNESEDAIVIDLSSDQLIPVANRLKKIHGFDMLVDLTLIDWGKENSQRNSRFTGVYHLYNNERYKYLRILVDCLTGDLEGEPHFSLPSLVSLWPAANWHEREAYDMFGVIYQGHPDLRRILMWDSYEYFPLRKDFPLSGIPTNFPSEEIGQAVGIGVEAAAMEGGPFRSREGSSMKEREPHALDEG